MFFLGEFEYQNGFIGEHDRRTGSDGVGGFRLCLVGLEQSAGL